MEQNFEMFSHGDTFTRAIDHSSKYFERVSALMNMVNRESLARLIQLIEITAFHGHKVILIGNGGSAATASHFANDLCRCVVNEHYIRAISLSDNVSSLTALANDFDYSEVFKRQLEVFLEDGDILIPISVSGNSENLLKAAEFAKSRGNVVASLLGASGGLLKVTSDHFVHVPSSNCEYGPVEDIHLMVDHLVSSFFLHQPKLN